MDTNSSVCLQEDITTEKVSQVSEEESSGTLPGRHAVAISPEPSCALYFVLLD